MIKTVTKITTVATNTHGVVYICREFDDGSNEWTGEYIKQGTINPFNIPPYTIIGSVLVADLKAKE